MRVGLGPDRKRIDRLPKPKASNGRRHPTSGRGESEEESATRGLPSIDRSIDIDPESGRPSPHASNHAFLFNPPYRASSTGFPSVRVDLCKRRAARRLGVDTPAAKKEQCAARVVISHAEAVRSHRRPGAYRSSIRRPSGPLPQPLQSWCVRWFQGLDVAVHRRAR